MTASHFRRHRLLRRFWPRLQFRGADQEARFRALHAQDMARRSALYVPVVIAVVICSAIGHLLLFPRYVWTPSLLLMLLFILLPLTFTWMNARRADGATRIYRSVHLTSVSSSIGVCLLIASARMQDYPIPYEGSLLVMMCVFLISGLHAFDSSRAALICLFGLIVVEWTWPISLGDSITRTFFGSTLWTLGCIFSVIVEASLRRDFSHRETLQALTQQDPLTGTLNRRGLEQRHATLVAVAQREHKPVTFAVVDIDHFKAYNDSHGHNAGDTALVAVSQVLNEHARRPLDLCARLGGEEFLLAWYDVDTTRGLALAEELRVAVAAATLPHQAADTGIVTVSVGVATANPVGDFDSLYRRADEALYAAKKAGRNCVRQAT